MDSKTQPEFDYKIKRKLKLTDKYDHSYGISIETDHTGDLTFKVIMRVKEIMTKYNLSWHDIIEVEVI